MSGLWTSGDDLLLPALHTADTAAEGPASASTADSFSSRFRCHCTSSRCRDRQASEGRGRRGRKRRGGRTEREAEEEEAEKSWMLSGSRTRVWTCAPIGGRRRQSTATVRW